MTTPLLEVQNITVAYGRHSPVLREISLTVGAGEVVGLVGMNGAGKSTLMSSISGALKPSSGRILFEGADIAGAGTASLARRGIVVLPEGHRVIRPLTVDENLQLSTMLLRPAEVRKRLAEVRDLIYELFPVLLERKDQLAGLLSGGEQQMLSVSRAIVQNPKLLLLDEPSLGLAPLIIDRIYQSFGALRERGMSMLIVEQNSERVARACSRMIVLREGRISAEGVPDALTGAALNSAYFG
ncbi:ABC transporter ATP-binding protein [Subtercola endophyticus]|uniref:ABC transporter ATP-binding protein n=1 Tax=Subtercola endophyticus TaxID=2895559 RepID=UPI001E5DC8BD|nr:ABC transporter ATP-binding protein [Subtercola endophyticus]UFS58336.1 ABC transporter ATP-binding protein [Subtercola endophyticus]